MGVSYTQRYKLLNFKKIGIQSLDWIIANIELLEVLLHRFRRQILRWYILDLVENEPESDQRDDFQTDWELFHKVGTEIEGLESMKSPQF